MTLLLPVSRTMMGGMSHGMWSEKKGTGRRPLTPIDTCLVCEEHIYSHDRYGFFSDGYAHFDCILFVRMQAAMVRASRKTRENG